MNRMMRSSWSVEEVQKFMEIACAVTHTGKSIRDENENRLQGVYPLQFLE